MISTKLIRSVNAAFYFNVSHDTLNEIFRELKIDVSKNQSFLNRDQFVQLLEYFERDINQVDLLFNVIYPELFNFSSRDKKIEQALAFFQTKIKNLDSFKYYLKSKFDKVTSIKSEFYTFSKNNLFGIMDNKENIIIDCIYNSIVIRPDTIFLYVRKGPDHNRYYEITVCDYNLNILSTIESSDYSFSYKSNWARISKSHVDVNNSNNDYDTFNYCDINGNLISKKDFYNASEFSDGYALVYTNLYYRKSGGDWIIGFNEPKFLYKTGELFDIKSSDKLVDFNEEFPRFSDGVLKCTKGFLNQNFDFLIIFEVIKAKLGLVSNNLNFDDFYNGVSIFKDDKNFIYGFIYKNGEFTRINSFQQIMKIDNFSHKKDYTLAFLNSTNHYDINNVVQKIVLISKKGSIFFSASVFSVKVFYEFDLIISNEVGSKVYLINYNSELLNVELLYSFDFSFDAKLNSFPIIFKTGIQPTDFIFVYNEFESNFRVRHLGILMNFGTKTKHIFENNFIHNISYEDNCIYVFLQDYYVLKLFDNNDIEDSFTYLKKREIKNGERDKDGWRTTVWQVNFAYGINIG